jgi:protoporphyrin/coproporphyrin ferrochelatase
MAEKLGVLVMAYGTPAGLDDVERYYTDIRRGRPPEPEKLAELTARYRAIGGRSPLLEITRKQAQGIQERLPDVQAFLGQKHSSPSIPEAVEEMKKHGIERAVGLVLAPHYSSMSIGDYAARSQRAAEECGWDGKLEMIESWHLEPGYIGLLSDNVQRVLTKLPEAEVVFTAHSLPERIVSQGDPYPHQLEETAAAVAERSGLKRWRTAWQSAGATSDAWLGPDVLDLLETLVAEGARGAIVCPCGFVSDHLEVLYDLDKEAASRAAELGIDFARTESPNDDPRFLDTMASLVARKLAGSS